MRRAVDADNGSAEVPTSGLPADPAVVPEFDHRLAAAVNAALVGELDEGLAVDPHTPFGDERRLFAALYLRHRYTISQHAWRYLHDRRDVDEVVQETFLRLFLALPDLESEAQAIAWCRRTATNLCIDRYRAAQRRPSLVDLDGVAHQLITDEEPSDPLVQAEDAAVVRHALSLLSPRHRDALVKREIEEKTLQEIAVELDIPEESVKHLLYRARRALRRLLVDTSVAPGRGLAVLVLIAFVLSLPTVVLPALDRAVGGGAEPTVTAGSPSAGGGLSSSPLAADPTPGETGPEAAEPGGPAIDPAGSEGVTADAPSTADAGSGVVRAEPEPPAGPAAAPLVADAGGPASADVHRSSVEQVIAPPAARGPAVASAPAAPEPTADAAPPPDSEQSEVLTATPVVEPRYSLSGMPVISSEAWVEEQALDLDEAGGTVARSKFVAQTLDVDLTLNQKVSRNADQSITFTVDADLVRFGEELPAAVISQDSTAVTNDDGTVTVSVLAELAGPPITATLRPFGSSPPSTGPSDVTVVPRFVRIVVVYSGDLTDVLSESVHAS